MDTFDLTQPIYLTALSLYFHQEMENPRYVAPIDIRDTIDAVVGSGIDMGSQLQELREKGLVERNQETYRLTNAGLEFCLGRMEIPANVTGGVFLDVDVDKEVYRETIPDHSTYVDIIHQVNRSYRTGIFSGTALLCRGLFEQLTYQILHDIYDPLGDVDMFYDVDHSRHYRFGELLKKLKTSHSEIARHHAELASKDIFIAHTERIKDIKELGDTTAHSIRTEIGRPELNPLAVPLSDTFEIFYTVLLEVNQ